MRGAALIAVTLLAACHEPTFEERYAETEKAVRASAAAIDKELAEQEKLRREAEGVESATPAPASPPAAR